MPIEQLKTAYTTTKSAWAEVDYVEIAMAEFEKQRTVIVEENINLLVLLILQTQSDDQEIFLKAIGKENVETGIYSFKSFVTNNLVLENSFYFCTSLVDGRLHQCCLITKIFITIQIGGTRRFEPINSITQIGELHSTNIR